MKPKAKAPPKHRPPKHQFVRISTVLRMVAREAAEYRASLDEANALKARYERAKA